MTNARRAVALAIGLLNVALYGVGFLLATRLFYGGRLGPALICGCFLAIGAATRFWSVSWWSSSVPAVAGFFWGLGAFKWAIHLTDTLGEYAPPMTQYIFNPSASEVLWAAAAGAAALVGWWVANRLFRTDRRTVG